MPLKIKVDITKLPKKLKEIHKSPHLYLTDFSAIALCRQWGILTPFELVLERYARLGICGEGFDQLFEN